MAEVAIHAALNVLGSTLAKDVASLATSQILEFRSTYANLEANMNIISSELRVMQAFLHEIEIDNPSNACQVVWIKEVQKLAYHIEDIVIEFSYLIGIQKYGKMTLFVTNILKAQKSLVDFNRLASQLLQVEKSLKHLTRMKQRWLPIVDMRNGNNYNLSNQYAHNVDISAHFMDEHHLVGIKENREILTKWLNAQELQLHVISVWGMSSVGKTTLVTNVFKSEKTNFDCNAWINISQSYTLENLLRNIITEISNENNPINTYNMDLIGLKDNTRRLLNEKKYLIVLDDMWDPNVFEDIRDTLIDNNQGSRIVITSRIARVANLGTERNRLELKPLSKDKSWDLFCRKTFHLEKNHNYPSFSERWARGIVSMWDLFCRRLPRIERNYECPPHLEKWARQIVLKCDGLPLALVSLGGLLSRCDKTELEWRRVHDQLIWELDKNRSLDHLKNVLNVSFKYLPKHLKNCFLYSSLFPKDFLLPRKKLIRLWIAEGFIEQSERRTLEEVAEGYLMELIHRSMLQVARKNYFGRVKRCQMHDTWRELAITICRRENFGLLHEENKLKNIDSFTRRLSTIKVKETVQHDVSLPKLRTFLSINDDVPLLPLLFMIFDKSRYLTVLDLEGLPIESIPNAIGDLFNLHYLGLRKTKVKFLPKSIKKLHNLQTLDLMFSQIQKLPHGIAELKKLRHLFVLVEPTHRSPRVLTGISLPKSMFLLKELQTVRTIESNAMVVRELGNLTQLRSFRIMNVKEQHSVELCRSLSKMNLLSSLHINASDVNEVLQLEGLNLSQIQKLGLHGQLNETMLASPLLNIFGNSIQSLCLRWSQLQNDPLPSLSHCQNLTDLYLKRVYEGQQLVFRAEWFPKLKRLKLKLMPNLIRVTMEQGTMPCLEQLCLLELRQILEVPMGIEDLSSLKWMTCKDLDVHFGGFVRGTHRLHHFTCHIL